MDNIKYRFEYENKTQNKKYTREQLSDMLREKKDGDLVIVKVYINNDNIPVDQWEYGKR